MANPMVLVMAMAMMMVVTAVTNTRQSSRHRNLSSCLSRETKVTTLRPSLRSLTHSKGHRILIIMLIMITMKMFNSNNDTDLNRGNCKGNDNTDHMINDSINEFTAASNGNGIRDVVLTRVRHDDDGTSRCGHGKSDGDGEIDGDADSDVESDVMGEVDGDGNAHDRAEMVRQRIEGGDGDGGGARDPIVVMPLAMVRRR